MFFKRNLLHRISNRLIIAFLFVVLVPLVGTNLYNYRITSNVLSERAIEAMQNDVRLRAEQIVGFLDGVRGDVLYLAHLDSLRKLIYARAQGNDAEAARWRRQVIKDFLTFSASRPAYYQVRYIAEDGWEIVRVDSDGLISYVIPDAALQNKAHRYYFTETMALSSGQVYVSPLDLNVEHGRIEIPYRPVIRYATPVFDESGSRRGIVIINVYAERFLSFLYETEGQQGILAMVDQDGFYLAHPNPEKRWGRDLGTGYNVRQDYPDGWQAILSGESGVWHGPEGVVVYTPIYPYLGHSDYYWVIFHDIPRTTLFASIARFRTSAMIILSGAVLTALVMAVVLARQLTAPILNLRRGIERFSKGELDKPLPVLIPDEVGELTQAFNDMVATLRRHLRQLDLLNRAVQRIATGLERSSTLKAAIEAAQTLFPSQYCVISLSAPDSEGETVAIASGDRGWAAFREIPEVRRTLQRALDEGHWQCCKFTLPDGSQGVLCCAPLGLKPESRGTIEVYGRDSLLIEPAAGNLLQTLALHTGTALENVELYEELSSHRQQLKALVERLISAHEEERKIVAYDIHDGLIPYLVSARLHLVNALTLWDKDPEQARRFLSIGKEHLTIAIAEGRRIIEGLRPGLLDDLGLVAALEQLVKERAEAAGWEVTYTADPPDFRAHPTVEIIAFRIAQEALTNAYKYAEARKVDVSLQAQDGRLVLQVRDWGKGFDVALAMQSRKCIGLVGMKERAALLGGKCIIESHPGEGTHITAILPMEV